MQEEIMNVEKIEYRKQAAVDFLQLVVKGLIDEAYQKYINEQKGRHHNPFFPAGFPALKQGMKENHEQMPKKQLTVRHVLADGKIVAVHSELVLARDGSNMRTVHLFRFEDDRVVELWDMGQELPVNSPNKDGAF
jgi:predicted SnoaL-like aldol condensation-catalyzing enzyme